MNRDKIIDKIEKKIDSIEKLHDKESLLCEEVKDLLADLRDEMPFDEADSVQTQLTAGSSITFKLLPEGSSTGDRKFEGASVITGMSVSQPLDGIVARSVTFQGTGALTIGTE